MRAKGGTKAARRATALLHDPEVLARGTPGLRVAVDLRRASCAGKRALFERAAAEGDARVLAELHILGADRCRRAKDPCCFRGSEDLERAIEALTERAAGQVARPRSRLRGRQSAPAHGRARRALVDPGPDEAGCPSTTRKINAVAIRNISTPVLPRGRMLSSHRPARVAKATDATMPTASAR